MEVTTTGDRRADTPIWEMGGKGVFVKEVQQAVLDGRADVAVHSAKDLPARTPDGLSIGAVPERADPRDALVGSTLDGLPTGARVATGSARRRAQLAWTRPDLTFVGLRGNVATRLERLDEVDAVVVAAAALDRLGLEDRATERLDPSTLVPQVGQGSLAVERREDDRAVGELVAEIEHPRTRYAFDAERAFLEALGGDCSLPAGAHATVADDGSLSVVGVVASLDGHVLLRQRVSGEDAVALGHGLARALLDEGGGEALMVTGASPAAGGSSSSSSPLAGRRVVVTRPRRQAASLCRRLREAGAEVVEAPVIEIVDPEDGGEALRAAAASIGSYRWVVCTSANGARRLLAAMGDARDSAPRVAAIGPGTAQVLEAGGVPVDLVPEQFVAEALVEAFPDPPSEGDARVLLARAAVARDVLPDGLRSRGWDVDVVEAYRTVRCDHTPDVGRAVAAADTVTFTSPSTVEAFLAAFGDQVPDTVACIGPVTAAAARAAGLAVQVEAATHTVPGLVDALVDDAGRRG